MTDRAASPQGQRTAGSSPVFADARQDQLAVETGRIGIDAGRVQAQLAHLATFTDAPPPAVTRILWTSTDLAGRAYVTTLLEEVGLELRTDEIGTIYARWTGSDPSLSPVATGSHVDAIPNAGLYDGCVGVIGAIEAVRALRHAGFVPARSIEIIVFASEEPTRFGVGCLGSRLMSGAMSPDQARGLRDGEGHGVEEARRQAGWSGPLENVRIPEGTYHAFLELHIEQGPVLERLGLPIGVVTAIAAPATVRAVITGEGGHAGGLLMPDRHDALTASAELILCVEAAARGTGSIDTVGTVGQVAVFPGAVNGVPSEVRLSMDVRDVDGARRDGVLRRIGDDAAGIASRRGVRIDLEVVTTDLPETMDPGLRDVLEASAADAGLATHQLPSRAYHDALFMPRICPTAMVFVPCRGGVSHRPDEFTAPEEVANGVRVLAHALARLSG